MLKLVFFLFFLVPMHDKLCCQSHNFLGMAKEVVAGSKNLKTCNLPVTEPKMTLRCPPSGVLVNAALNNSLFADSVLLIWQIDKKSVSFYPEGYFIKIKSLDETFLDTFRLTTNYLTLYFDKPQIENELVLNISIIFKGNKIANSCEELYFYHLKPAEKKAIMIEWEQNIGVLKEKNSLKRLTFALFLQSKSLFIDALANYQEAYNCADKEEKAIYQKILADFKELNCM